MSMQISSFITRAIHTSRMLAIALAMALGTTRMASAEPQNPLAPQADSGNPLARQNGDAPPAATAKITTEQLGQILDDLKLGKNTVTNNNFTYYTVNIPRGKWTFPINVSLSPSGNVLWLNVPLNAVDPAKVSTATLIDILHKNNDIGPMFFELVGSRHMLNLAEPIPNRDLTTARVHNELESLIQTLMDTEALWKEEAVSPGQAAGDAPAPVNPLASPGSAPVNPLANPRSAPVNPLANPPAAPVNPLSK